MDAKTLQQNLYRVYADFSDFTEDFNAAGSIDKDTRAAGLRELRTAKLELRDATHSARAAIEKVSRVFSWEPDKTEGAE